MRPIYFPLLFLACTSCGGSFDDRLEAEAREQYANHCPERIDADTRLDSIGYHRDTRQLVRVFSISERGEDVLRRFPTEARTQLLSAICNDPAWDACREHGVTLVMIYRRQDTGAEVARFAFTEDDYRR